MTWHEFLIIETSQNKHQGMTWLKYITMHPRINIGLHYIRNIDEYVPKLQLHQHSLLTRKVFSRHNISAQAFFSVSSGSSSSNLRLHVIFIFKSSLFSSHLHLQVIFIFRSSSFSSHLHHRIWIITRSGSSSLDLDHHWIWIITGHHHWI